MPPKTGLGRGLGALIPNKKPLPPPKQPAAVETTEAPVVAPAVVAPADPKAVHQLTLDKIQPDPNQPRKHFDHHALEDLMSSIKEHGILQPLVVTPADSTGKHMIIAGERRFRASQMLGLKQVPVIVRDVKDQQRLELAIVENIQRADLNPIEEAHAYQRLMNEFNLTQDEVGKRVGKSRPGVANILRLLELPSEVQSAVADGKISAGHAKILAGLERPAEQQAYLQRILKHNLTVRELEEQTQTVRRVSKPKVGQKFDPIQQAQEDLLRERLGTKTTIKKSGDKGQIIIHFYSREELQRLLQELT